MNEDNPARPAATVVLLRPKPKADIDGSAFEVLLLQRNKALKFAGGNWVFPGGKIEQDEIAENDALAAAKCAAARETHEEAGIKLEPNKFQFIAHFTTPVSYPKRFATWFLLGALETAHTVQVDEGEIVNHQWITPQAAINKYRNGELTMMSPTYWCLLKLSQFNNIETVLAAFAEKEINNEVPHFAPKMVKQDGIAHVLYQEDCAYDSEDLNAEGPKHRQVMRDDGYHLVEEMI